MMTALHETLRAFGRQLRDPHHVPRPAGLPARPVSVYGELVFNNFTGFLDACFPLCRQLLGEDRWLRLERRFFRDWPCQTPWFRQIPAEFVAFLVLHGRARRLPRWFPELAHYEWAELAVDQMDCLPSPHRAGDLMTSPVVVNPALMNLAYQWPVDRIGPEFRPRRPEPTWLAVYRNGDDAVRFTRLTPASARLLALLAEGGMTGEAAILRLAGEMGHPEPEKLMAFGAEEIRKLHLAGLLLGVEA